MKDVVYLLAILVAAALGAVVTGRGVIAVARLRRFSAPSLENLSVAAFLGTGFWMLAGGWLFSAGVPGRGAAAGVAVASLALVLTGRSVGPRRSGGWRPWAGVLLAALWAGAAVMTPLMLGGAYDAHNDGYTYACHAEVLQQHGFVNMPEEARRPTITDSTILYHDKCLRMGVSFLLGLLRGCVPSRLALELLPAVVAWGLALNALAVGLVCRWTFRLERAYAVAGATVAFGCITPLHFSTTANLAPQLYGTATLVFLTAALSRSVAPRRRWWEWSVLIGIETAVLASAYSELIPVLTIAAAGVLVVGGLANRRTGRAGTFWRTAGLAVLIALAVGNYEWVRVVRAVLFQFNDGVGYRIEWTAWEFWRFAVGAQTYGGAYSWGTFIPPENVLGRGTLVAAGWLATGLFGLGLLRAAVTPAGRVAAASVGVLLAMGAVFLFTRDPWSGTAGHTWNLFKIGQWIYPLVLAVQLAGLAWVARWLRAGPGLATHLAVLAVGLSLPLHLSQARESATALRNWFRAERPLAAMRDMHKLVVKADPDLVLYVPESAALFPECWVHYLCYPYAVDDGRSGTMPTPSNRTLSLTHRPGTGTPWAYGFSTIDPTLPILGGIENPNEVERGSDGELFFWLGTQPASVEIWGASGETALLRFDATAGPSRPDSPTRTLVLTDAAGGTTSVVIQGLAPVTVPVALRPGKNKVLVRCAEPPTAFNIPGEKRHLMVRVEHLQVSRPAGPHRQ